MCGANLDADRIFHVCTSVTLECDFPLGPWENDTIRTVHRTRPTGNTAVFTDDDEICLGVTDQSTGEAGVQAGSVKAMSALEGEGYLIISLHVYTRLGRW